MKLLRAGNHCGTGMPTVVLDCGLIFKDTLAPLPDR
jgi:hypothetical protein